MMNLVSNTMKKVLMGSYNVVNDVKVMFFFIIVLQNVISVGAGEELVSQYRSVIFYHSGKPEWVETIKVSYTLSVLKSCLKANTEKFGRIIYGQGQFFSCNF